MSDSPFAMLDQLDPEVVKEVQLTIGRALAQARRLLGHMPQAEMFLVGVCAGMTVSLSEGAGITDRALFLGLCSRLWDEHNEPGFKEAAMAAVADLDIEPETTH